MTVLITRLNGKVEVVTNVDGVVCASPGGKALYINPEAATASVLQKVPDWKCFTVTRMEEDK